MGECLERKQRIYHSNITWKNHGERKILIRLWRKSELYTQLCWHREIHVGKSQLKGTDHGKNKTISQDDSIFFFFSLLIVR